MLWVEGARVRSTRTVTSDLKCHRMPASAVRICPRVQLKTKPYTLNPNPETQNPNPETLNPKPPKP